MKEAGVIDDKLAKSILPKDPKPGRLRLQPKIHKENHPSRPIISTNGTATEKLSAYVDYKLTPLMCKRVIPSYIRDSMDFLNHLQKIKTIGQESLLVSMDVVSLYTNIPHNDGIEAMEKYLNRFSEDKQEIPWIAKAANLVLTNNNFVFDDQHYLQIQGTAMGTKLAPKYANIFMANLESNLLDKTPLKPQYYCRFIDDCFLIWTHGKEKLSEFVTLANSLHPTIKFTFECSTNWITFLDVKVHIINNKLETEIFSKETDSHQYLSPSSCHPKHVTKNIPKSLFIRIRRTCSTNELFDKHAKIMKTYLTKRNYKENLVEDAIQSAKKLDRKLLLIPKTETKKETLLSFITNYHPTQPNLRKIFSDYQYILDNNDRLKEIFPKPPRLAYRKCPTLRDKLVRAKLKPETPVKKNPGFFKCGRKSCSTCQYSEERKIATNKQKTAEIRIRQKVTCNSENVIYLISCKKCGMQYIGETGRHLKYRITEHIRSIKTQNKDLVVGAHFSQPGHSLKDLSVIGIEKLFHDHIYRKNKESHYIHLFGTHEPQGMNIKEV
ncbi:uncharacterized protein LOC120337843 [Styela clava]